MMKNLIRKKKGERSKVTFIKKQLTKENSNWMELFQGPSGSGKTWSALSQAYAIDPEFDPSTQLVFDFPGLMKVINSDWFRKKKWRIIIFDEPQISISNRNWQNIQNKMMNYLVTTFRHQNIALLFCAPYRDFLDSASMKMLHCITEMVSINRKNKKTKTRPKLQQYNSQLKKTYEHSLFVMNKKKIRKLTYHYILKPPQEMIDTYEAMKTEFTSKLNLEIEQEMLKIKSNNEPKPEEKEQQTSEFEGKGMLTAKQQDVLNCWKRGIFRTSKIAEELGVKIARVVERSKSMRKKGFHIEQYRDKANKVDGNRNGGA